MSYTICVRKDIQVMVSLSHAHATEDIKRFPYHHIGLLKDDLNIRQTIYAINKKELGDCSRRVWYEKLFRLTKVLMKYR